VVIIIISIITSVKSKELIMKGVRRQRHTGCMTMMMMAKFLLLANVLSNVPAARDRMVGGVAGSRAPRVGGTQCVKTIGHCCKQQLQVEERRNLGPEAQS